MTILKQLRLTPLQISSTKNKIDFNNHHKGYSKHLENIDMATFTIF